MNTYPISQKILILPRWSQISINIKFFWVLIFVLIGILLIFYIFQVSAFAKEAYLIKNYEKKLKEIAEEKKKLEIEFSKLNSLENMEILVKNLGFEKVKKVDYIRVLEGVVVKK
jgi:hypothetical protein